MPNLPPVGAQAELLGLQDFLSGIDRMNKAVASFGSAVDKQMSFPSRQAGKELSSLDIAVGSLAGNLAARALGAVADFGRGVLSSGVEMARTAGRADELRIVAQYVGAAYGQTTRQVDDQIEAIQQAGIRYDMAARAVVDMTEAQLDMSKSTDLVKIAQASAIKSGQDSSATLQNIIYGIRTLQPEVLRTAGITLSLDEAMAMYTDEAGRHVKAVTGQEKQQALFNAVLQKGAGLLGLYDVAMQEPEKRLRSLDRVTYEISRTVGANFKPSFGDSVSILEYFAKSVLAAVSDGGALHDLLLNFGAAAGAFSDSVLGMAKSATDFGVAFAADMGTSLSGAADDALAWGVNIITQLADGIIQGASGALVAAMDFIGGILSAFLSPGSPPKVAPDIDAWGAAAMDEYLRGFSEADYGILESVQGPLQSVLEMLGRSGDFSTLNAELARSLSAVGDGAAASAEFLSKLSSIGGVYGQELSRLVSLQTDLAGATSRAAEADKAYEEQQATVARLTKEYEKLAAAQEGQAQVGLLGGYEKDRFKVRAMGAAAGGPSAEKKAALDAEKAKLDALDSERKAAREREAQAKSLLSLQEKLVKQLIAQAQWQDRLAKQTDAALKKATEIDKKPATARKGAGAGAAGLAGGMQIPKIGALVNEELDKAKASISAKLGELFAPLRAKWESSMKPALDGLASKFEWFRGVVGRVLAEIGEAARPVADAVSRIISPDILSTIGEFIGVAAVAGGGILGVQFVLGLAATAAGAFGSALLALAANPVALAAAGIALVAVALDKYGSAILGADAATATFGQRVQVGFWGMLNDAATTVSTMGKIIQFKYAEFLTNISTTAGQILFLVQYKFWETLNNAYNTVATIGRIIEYEFWNFLNNASMSASLLLEAIRLTIETKLTEAQAKWKEITDKIAEGWRALWEGIKAKFDELWGKIQASLTAARNFFRNSFYVPVKEWIDDLAHGLAFLIGMFEDLLKLANKVGAKVSNAISPKPAGSRQGGGPVSKGLWRLHDREYVLSEKMRSGQQAIPPSALSLAALSRLVRTPARSDRVAVPAMAVGGSNVARNVSVEINPTYQQAQTPASIYYDVVSALRAAKV